MDKIGIKRHLRITNAMLIRISIKALIRTVSEFFYKRENIDLYSDRVTTFGIKTTRERIF